MAVYIYVIEDESGAIKIGFSNNPEKRRTALQTGYPGVLTLRAKREVPIEISRQVEANVLRRLRASVVAGEWFRCSSDEALTAIDAAVADPHGRLETPLLRGTSQSWSLIGIDVRRDGADFVVSVRDLPEVVTSGDSLEHALDLASDAIEVAVAGRIEDGMDLPEPSPVQEGEHAIALPAPLAAKVAVYAAWKQSGLKKVELAKAMNRNEAEVRRILDPRHGTKLDQLDEAARALGGRLVVRFEPA